MNDMRCPFGLLSAQSCSGETRHNGWGNADISAIVNDEKVLMMLVYAV